MAKSVTSVTDVTRQTIDFIDFLIFDSILPSPFRVFGRHKSKNPKIIKIPVRAYIAGTKISELAPSRGCRGSGSGAGLGVGRSGTSAGQWLRRITVLMSTIIMRLAQCLQGFARFAVVSH